jgi:precorrin-6A/cobalt-precorrin-6A reductase
MTKILLLGGVADALAIARTLGPQHIYSLAGVGRVPTDLACQVRVGGYGGAQGLARFIAERGIDLLVDATHPYAAQMSHNAARAAALASVPCWALRRPAWQPGPNDDWREVAGWAELVQALQPFQRPLFTLGREPLQHLDEIPAHQFWVLRALENTLRDLPQHPRCEVVGARGPFLLDDERALFVQRAIDVLVSKNSGGDATDAKLEVARELNVPVMILKRPELPEVDREFGSRQALQEALCVQARSG